MDPGVFAPTWIAGNGYSYAMSVMDGASPVDTSGWDAKFALRAAYVDTSPVLLLTVGAGITVGQGDDNEVIVVTVSDTQTDGLITDLEWADSTPFKADMTVLLDGAADWAPFLRGAVMLEAAATRLGEDGS